MGVLNGHGAATVKSVEIKVSKNGREYAAIKAWFSCKKSTDNPEDKKYFNTTIFCFQNVGEASCLKEGDNIMVDGPMSYRLWQNPQGETLVFFDITANSIKPFIAKPYEPKQKTLPGSSPTEPIDEDVPF